MSAIANNASNGGVSSNAHAEEISAKLRDWYLLSRLLRLLAPYWFSMLLSFLCSLASTALQVFNPLIISIAITP